MFVGEWERVGEGSECGMREESKDDRVGIKGYRERWR